MPIIPETEVKGSGVVSWPGKTFLKKNKATKNMKLTEKSKACVF